MESNIRKCFVMKYDEMVKLAVMIVGDKAISDDILHEVIVNLLTREDELNDIDNYLGFITVCLRRAALNYYRKKSRTELRDPDIMAETLMHPGTDAQYDYVEWVLSLHHNLSEYKPEYRQAFIDCFVDGVPAGEIALKLGISKNAMELRFKRMKKTLQGKDPGIARQLYFLSLL